MTKEEGGSPVEWVQRAQIEGRIKTLIEDIMKSLNYKGLTKLYEFLQRFKPHNSDLKKQAHKE